MRYSYASSACVVRHHADDMRYLDTIRMTVTKHEHVPHEVRCIVSGTLGAGTCLITCNAQYTVWPAYARSFQKHRHG